MSGEIHSLFIRLRKLKLKGKAPPPKALPPSTPKPSYKGQLGGARVGAGRKLGSKAKKTIALAEAVMSKHMTPLEFFAMIYEDEKQPKDLRVRCAESAAPYVHPKRGVIIEKNENEGEGSGAGVLKIVIENAPELPKGTK